MITDKENKMKNLIVHKNGEVIFTMGGESVEGEYNCIVAEVEDNKEIVSVDVLTNQVITKDKELTKTETLELENEELSEKIIELTAQNLINN